MPRLTVEEVLRLIAGGETSRVEFKVHTPRSSELAERLCGLANAQGGWLIVGVDDHQEIVGDNHPKQTVDLLLYAARSLIEPSLRFNPPEPERFDVGGKTLVVATVPRSNGPIYQTGGVYWVRRGSTTVRLTLEEMLELAHERGLVRWELQPVQHATMDDLDQERITQFLTTRLNGPLQKERLAYLEQTLLALRCAVRMPDQTLRPTGAGMLFFGRDPQQFLPQSEVVCVLFADELGVGGYLDRKIIHGTMLELIDEARLYLAKHVAVGAVIKDWTRTDVPEYPLDALREALINAIVHRNYAAEGQSIRIFLYKDRVEFHSPGLLLPGITVEAMQRGEVASKLRNPALAGLLRDVPGYFERLGLGIRLMLAETARASLPPPEFRELSGEFLVVFRKALVSSPPALFLTPVDVAQTSEEKQAEPASILEQEERLQRAMRYVGERGSITNQVYRALTGVSEKTAQRDLECLVERGALKFEGERRARRYLLP